MVTTVLAPAVFANLTTQEPNPLFSPTLLSIHEALNPPRFIVHAYIWANNLIDKNRYKNWGSQDGEKKE
jgi:hypothetical protein